MSVEVSGRNVGWDPRPNVTCLGDCPDDYCGCNPNQMNDMDHSERAPLLPTTDFETYQDAM